MPVESGDSTHTAPRLFVSYSHFDRQHADRIAKAARDRGLDVWIDHERIKVGDSIPGAIAAAIRASDFLVPVISRRGVSSAWVEEELSAAFVRQIDDNSIRILPVLIDDCEIPVFLRSRRYADCRSDFDAGLRDLLSAIAPGARKSGASVVFDEAHHQERWHVKPCLELDYSLAARALSAHFQVQRHQQGVFADEIVCGWNVLIFPMPFGVLLDDAEYQTIARWVYKGGGLLLCGFYFMEAHLYTNFNMLASKLGLEFHENLIMPVGREAREDILAQAYPIRDDLCVSTAPRATNMGHPLLEGIRAIALHSSCTLEAAFPDAELRVATDARVTVIAPKGPRPGGPKTKITQIQGYDRQRDAHPTFLMAVTHGKGRVVAVGTWKLFVDQYADNRKCDNLKLFANIVKWLAKTGTGLAGFEG